MFVCQGFHFLIICLERVRCDGDETEVENPPVELLFVYDEGIKRDPTERRPIYECRYDERLQTKSEGSAHLTYTGLLGGLLCLL